MQDQVVMVTGASAGIGAALARLVGQKGGRPVLLARRQAELDRAAAAAGPHALALRTDVTRRAEVDAAVAATLARFGRIDVLINNAGRGISRPVSQLTDEDVDEMFTINVKSALYGMQAVLPHFRATGRGHIINVSSLLGRVPYVTVRSAYSAAKHALGALSANLRMELRTSHPGIAVTTVYPGVVATEFGLAARHGGIDSRSIPGGQSADDVAAVIVDAIDHRRPDVYTRPGARELVAGYYAAEDVSELERRPPFG